MKTPCGDVVSSSFSMLCRAVYPTLIKHFLLRRLRSHQKRGLSFLSVVANRMVISATYLKNETFHLQFCTTVMLGLGNSI